MSVARSIQSVGAVPYTKEDLFREASEGRSLHDDASRFYREVMGLETPVSKEAQPSVSAITDAIEAKVKSDDLCKWTIVYSLFLTNRNELFPPQDDLNHSIGCLLRGCKAYKAAALKFIRAESLNLNLKRGTASDTSTAKRTKISSTASPKKGKAVGKKNWSQYEFQTLLDVTEAQLPCGKEMWEKVAPTCYASDAN